MLGTTKVLKRNKVAKFSKQIDGNVLDYDFIISFCTYGVISRVWIRVRP